MIKIMVSRRPERAHSLCMRRIVICFLLVVLSLPGALGSQSAFVDTLKRQELVQTGRRAYVNRCSGCHGLAGDGNGPASAMLDPRPRDFTKAVFKFKATPVGGMPTNDDLLRTLNQGIPGTSMPSFALVSDTEKRAIIEYLKTLAPDAWKAQDPAAPVPLPAMPAGVFTNKAKFMEYARVGRVWYQELGCVACHGVSGRGDGPSAETLTDAWGFPIRPANLHKAYLKGGYTLPDVARAIVNGIDGTPMPANGPILDHLAERFPEVREKRFIWELAAYVFYLRGEQAGIYKEGEIPAIPAERISPEEVKATVGKYFEEQNP
jgi:mono/diheme cytochrome c family protein